MWILYVPWNLPTSPVLSLSSFSSNVKTISAAEAGISTIYKHSSFLQFCVGEDKTWTGSMDPLLWTGSMDTFS